MVWDVWVVLLWIARVFRTGNSIHFRFCDVDLFSKMFWPSGTYSLQVGYIFSTFNSLLTKLWGSIILYSILLRSFERNLIYLFGYGEKTNVRLHIVQCKITTLSIVYALKTSLFHCWIQLLNHPILISCITPLLL